MRISITSGFYNPLTESHIEYLQAARCLGGIHIAIVNNDYQVKLKNSCPFQDEWERMQILMSMKWVDDVCLSIDFDESVADTIQSIVDKYRIVYNTLDIFTGKKQDIEWIFAKGGDRNDRNSLPLKELEILDLNGFDIRFGVGGSNKVKSSSGSLLQSAKWHLDNKAASLEQEIFQAYTYLVK